MVRKPVLSFITLIIKHCGRDHNRWFCPLLSFLPIDDESEHGTYRMGCGIKSPNALGYVDCSDYFRAYHHCVHVIRVPCDAR